MKVAIFGLLCWTTSVTLTHKVVGSVRTQGEKKHVMAFKITAVSCKAEWDAHLLQVATVKHFLSFGRSVQFKCDRWFTPS